MLLDSLLPVDRCVEDEQSQCSLKDLGGEVFPHSSLIDNVDHSQ